jgi:hypothetical protein
VAGGLVSGGGVVCRGAIAVTGAAWAAWAAPEAVNATPDPLARSAMTSNLASTDRGPREGESEAMEAFMQVDAANRLGS